LWGNLSSRCDKLRAGHRIRVEVGVNGEAKARASLGVSSGELDTLGL
jgi:hypothetical protein